LTSVINGGITIQHEKGLLQAVCESETLETPNHTNNGKTPLKAIRANCHDCCGSEGWKDIAACKVMDSHTHEYRFEKRPIEKAKLTPGNAIDEYCLHCMGAREVNGEAIGRAMAQKRARECNSTHCELWHMRYGSKKYVRQEKGPLQAVCEPEASVLCQSSLNDANLAGSSQ